MPDNEDFYNVVVLGAMNPSIHHPGWYQLVGLITADEAGEAYASKSTFNTPPLAQLEVSGLTIVCQEGRWEVRTQDDSKLDRACQITAKVFDDLLKHTPVQAIGFNIDFRRHTECSDVGGVLANQLTSLKVGLDEDHAVGGEFVLRRRFDDHSASVIVRPAQTGSSISVANNYHYPIEGEGFVLLQEYFDKRFRVDCEDAKAQTERLVQFINNLTTN